MEFTECHDGLTQIKDLRSAASFFIWLDCELLAKTAGVRRTIKSELDGHARVVRESQLADL